MLFIHKPRSTINFVCSTQARNFRSAFSQLFVPIRQMLIGYFTRDIKHLHKSKYKTVLAAYYTTPISNYTVKLV